MEQSLHKQKLYSLIIAGIGFIAILLPWFSFFIASANGLRGWGLLSLVGVGGVVAASLIGDKTKPFDDTFRKVALASFGAMALGALLFFIRLSSAGLGSVGFGLWLCLIAGALGLLFVLGIIKLPDTKKPPVS
jgi:hypothetical protein